METKTGRQVDLHTHTIASDGTLTPGELVVLAKKTGLAAVAITGHDPVAGLPEGLDGGAAALHAHQVQGAVGHLHGLSPVVQEHQLMVFTA